MKVYLSFDDGRIDAYDAYNILKKYKLKGSFHITTGFIDGTFATDSFGAGRKPLTIEQLTEMYQNGMDISSHGDKHIMENTDFSNSIEKLKKWSLVKSSRVGFSVPNSDFNDKELNEFVSSNEKYLSYVRVGRSPKCYSFFSKINYVLYHTLHLGFAFNCFNKHNLITSINEKRIYSLVVKNDTKIKHLINFIDKHKNKNTNLVIMLHSIVKSPQNGWEYDAASFEKLADYLSKNVKVLTLEEMVNHE